MTIGRDDLTAAAAAGLLQYRQIDPLLIFLLQRDIIAQRQALLAQPHPRPRCGLSFLLVVVPVLAVMLGVAWANGAAYAMGSRTTLFLGALYAAACLSVAAWLQRRGYGGRVRLMLAATMASVPLALVVLQQLGVG